MAKKTISIGIEYDRFSIRAARVAFEEIHGDRLHETEDLKEVRGRFDSDEALEEGLATMRREIEAGSAHRIVSCVNGKQVYIAQMPFRRLADDEMRRALRFDLRKKAPFEIAGSTIDFQILRTAQKAGETSDIIVSVVANALLHNHLRLLEKTGLRPDIVDLLPTAAANALAIARGKAQTEGCSVIIHVGPDASTLVFDGNAPFFTRSFYFDAEKLLGGQAETNAGERQEKLALFGQELLRSITYYEKTYRISNLQSLHPIGDYPGGELAEHLESAGLPIQWSTLIRQDNAGNNPPPGKFDLAVALALREE